MGTNYYIATTCPTCKHHTERIHIGKSSAGWVFSLHVTSELKSLSDWMVRLRNLEIVDGIPEKIYDEYGNQLDLHELLDVITNRTGKVNFKEKPYLYDSWEDFHKSNYSIPGPNGLLRHKVDGAHCVGHGDGTWDLITGDFS